MKKDNKYPKKQKMESYEIKPKIYDELKKEVRFATEEEAENMGIKVSNTGKQKKALKKLKKYAEELNEDVGLSALANMKYASAEEAKDVDLKKVGMKYDKGKLRYGLMPPDALAGVVRILTFGAEKYEDYNWKLVDPVSRYYDALLRHLEAVRQGEWIDADSGEPHMDHVMCNAVFLRELKWNGE